MIMAASSNCFESTTNHHDGSIRRQRQQQRQRLRLRLRQRRTRGRRKSSWLAALVSVYVTVSVTVSVLASLSLLNNEAFLMMTPGSSSPSSFVQAFSPSSPLQPRSIQRERQQQQQQHQQQHRERHHQRQRQGFHADLSSALHSSSSSTSTSTSTLTIPGTFCEETSLAFSLSSSSSSPLTSSLSLAFSLSSIIERQSRQRRMMTMTSVSSSVSSSVSVSSSIRTKVRTSRSVPHMFLSSSARLWSLPLSTMAGGSSSTSSTSSTTTTPAPWTVDGSSSFDATTSLGISTTMNKRRSRGVLGFAMHDDLDPSSSSSATSSSSSSSQLQSQQSQQRQSSAIVSSLFATRPSNVDSTQWNLPQSIDTTTSTSTTSTSTSSSRSPAQWWSANSMHGIWTSASSSSGAAAAAAAAGTGSAVTGAAGWFPWIPTERQIAALKVPELKQACAERGLAKQGLKADLKVRLQEWTAQQLVSIGQRQRLLRQEPFFVPPLPPLLLLDDDTDDDVEDDSDDDSGGGDSVNTSTASIVSGSSIVSSSSSSSAGVEAPADDKIDSNTADQDQQEHNMVEALLQRREAIHREKRQGKTVVKPDTFPEIPTREYLLALVELFEKPSSSLAFSNNLQVQQMYAAAKQADQLGDRILSRRILLQLKEATPNDARIYRRLARMEKEDGNLAAARAILHEGLRLHPDNAYLWHGLGAFAASDADTKECYKKAIASDPSLPHPYHALGTLEHTQGRIANAMKTLKKGVEYCPTNHRLHHALGDLYRDAKMLDMADKSYRKALHHGPPVSHGFAYTALAYVAYDQGQVDGCRSWLRKAVSLNNGRQANAWVALAQMEESEGNIDAARSVCIAALTKYERGLFERSRKIKFRRKRERAEEVYDQDPEALRSKFLKSVPQYRSGDRFFNVYRNWARLEERYGTVESVEDVYQRASLAFPGEWKLTIDWAMYYAKLRMHGSARELFTKACAKAGNRHAEPYRLFAAFDMSLGNYADARKILYRGSVAMSQSMDGGVGNRCGMPELFHTWAVCEWHLGELTRAEVLFDHALRMTNAGEEGSKLRSFILYSIARLEHFRGKPVLAQHCIGLCLKENLMPGGNSKIWELWSDVATEMGNEKLAAQCEEQAEQASLHEENGPAGLSRLLALKSPEASSSGLISRMQGPDMEQLMRRDPWHQKIFTTGQRSSFFYGVRLPEKEQ